ncbi:hypothetical protein [Desulfosporosinus sp. SB140]|uniref:hypothetical protein n=1 Tax=Desulfosporosinus paludis TaxID=3115649 RepID=UPI003890757B
MKAYGTVATSKLMQTKDVPAAGPVKNYRLEEEFETKITRNLQALIRLGKPQMEVEAGAKREAIQQIIIACVKELDKDVRLP